MARRPRALKRAKFKLSSLREVLLQCSDMLYKAISKQNPEVDQDDVEDALRALVRQLGVSAPASTDDSVETPASFNDDKPPYNLAGDILAIASEHFHNKDYKNAFKLFSTAMEADGAIELIAGIKEMNAQTTVAEAAESMTDIDEEMDSDVEDDFSADDFSDENDAMDEVVSELDEESSEEEIADEDEDEDAFGPDGVMDEVEVDADLDEDDDEEDEDEDEDDSSDNPEVPMGSASSQPTQAALRALANKLSLDGSDASRKRAAKIFSRK